MRRTTTRNRISAPAAAGDRLKAATLTGAGLLVAALLALAVSATGQEREAAPATPAPEVSAPQASPESPAAATPAPAGPRAAADSGSSPTPSGASGRRSGKGPRTLDEITIEGEIAVPQVLFITARERRHYQDFLHRNYLKGSRELCRETPVPVRLGSWF